MSADKFCCRMYYDVCSMFEWTDKIWCSECIVDDYWKSVFVRNFCNFIDIRNIWIWISKCFKIYGFCVWFDCFFYFFKIVCIYECCFYTKLFECVCKKVIWASINCFLWYDVVSCLCQSLNCVCDCCCSWSYCQCCNTTFQCGYTFFQNILSGICKSSINISSIS